MTPSIRSYATSNLNTCVVLDERTVKSNKVVGPHHAWRANIWHVVIFINVARHSGDISRVRTKSIPLTIANTYARVTFDGAIFTTHIKEKKKEEKEKEGREMKKEREKEDAREKAR